MEAERPSYMEPEAPPDAATVERVKARLIAQIRDAEGAKPPPRWHLNFDGHMVATERGEWVRWADVKHLFGVMVDRGGERCES